MRFTAIAFLAASLLAAPVAAQEWPVKPVRVIVPLTPGSGADIAARVVGKKLQEMWGQPVVVENRPGAGGQIGSQIVARAPADGYTLLIQSASHAANPAIYKKLPYDATQDFVDLALLATTPYVMVTAADGRHKNVKNLVDDAKAQPGALPFASAGVGTSTHLTAELFLQKAGVKMIHVPFKGSPDAVADVAGGRSLFYMAPLPTVVGLLKDGKLNPLAATSARRIDSLPNVPTIAESGYPGFSAELWIGLWAPAGLPAPVLNKIAADVTTALQTAEVKEQYARLGNQVRIMSPAEFRKFVQSEIETNKELVRNAGIQLE
jgi:tripartite-type tricarboxylate transporter receptor subunit TctC